MGLVGETVDSIKSIQIRQLLTQAIRLGMIVTSALIIWKALICVTGSDSPVVVVLSESMEPGFQRGDILFLHMSKDPIRAGEIVVFNIDGRDIPIVHRVIMVHERENTGEVDVLTKGDNNPEDDRLLYAKGQLWLNRHHIMGRAVGFLPYVGWVTIIMTEKPIIKTERCSSTVQVRYRFWEARNVPARPERMGVDMLLLDSQYRQRSTAEDAILDISREFEFVEQRSWVFCKYSSTQQHHELRCNLKTRFIGTSARNMENLDSTPRLKASFNLDTTVDALNTFVCETGTGKHVPRALFIILEPTVAVMVR
ncbi:hypothetical protein Bca101_008030 [Brassica carinata]